MEVALGRELSGGEAVARAKDHLFYFNPPLILPSRRVSPTRGRKELPLSLEHVLTHTSKHQASVDVVEESEDRKAILHLFLAVVLIYPLQHQVYKRKNTTSRL